MQTDFSKLFPECAVQYEEIFGISATSVTGACAIASATIAAVNSRLAVARSTT
jgi:hypothetical protein